MSDRPNLYELLCREHRGAGTPLELWYELVSCHVHVGRRLSRHLKSNFDMQLPSCDAMCALARFPEGLTMGKLAGLLVVSNGNVTGIIRRLEAAGLVSREAARADKRVFVVRLTRRGRGMWRKLERAYRCAITERLLAGVGAAEARGIASRLRKLKRRLAGPGVPGG
jgi:DNA-binding MarR family transcriptional regulator